MKPQTLVLAASLATALILSASAARAGGSVTATASVSVTILAPVTLQATQGLDFGAVTRPGNAAANTITLDPASSNVTLSGAGDGARAAGAVSPAKFSLVGEAGVTYSTTQSLTFAQPGLTRVSVSAPVAGNGSLGVIPAAGVQELRFGGAFDLNAATPAQAYAGSLTVTVNYN
jgi:spore coat protein U-like protein